MVSLSGPATGWPTASPITQAVRVIWTDAWEALISRASRGNAGRYRSMDNDARAVAAARVNSRNGASPVPVRPAAPSTTTGTAAHRSSREDTW